MGCGRLCFSRIGAFSTGSDLVSVFKGKGKKLTDIGFFVGFSFRCWISTKNLLKWFSSELDKIDIVYQSTSDTKLILP